MTTKLGEQVVAIVDGGGIGSTLGGSLSSSDPAITTATIVDDNTVPAAPPPPPPQDDNEHYEYDEDVTNFQSPVPLSREEARSAEVRKLARALAPSLVAAEELLLQVPSDFNTEDDDDEEEGIDDDDLDYEVEGLGASEDLLRRELEMANEFGTLFGLVSLTTPNSNKTSTSRQRQLGDDDDDDYYPENEYQHERQVDDEESNADRSYDDYCDADNDERNNNTGDLSVGTSDQKQEDDANLKNALRQEGVRPSEPSSPQNPKSQQPQRPPPPPRIEADVDDLDREDALDRLNHKDLLPPIRIPPSPLSIPHAVLSPMTPQHQHRRTNNGGVVEATSLFATPSSVTKRLNMTNPPIHYTALHHAAELHLDRPVHGWYRIQPRDVDFRHQQQPISDDLHEFCLSIPDAKLRQWFAGFPRAPVGNNTKSQLAAQQISPASSRSATTLRIDPADAVRTVTIRVRPDVLCGAVMEAVAAALTHELRADVTKRQGGHVQAIVPPALYLEADTTDRPLRYPGYRLEARLATSKGDAARYLVLRAFHINSDNNNSNIKTDDGVRRDTHQATTTTLLSEPIPLQPAVHLREACALIQRMESQGETSKRIHWNSGGANLTEQGIQDVVSAHLLDYHQPCPSVLDGAVTLPALNNNDFLIIQSSWRMVTTIWEEIESRGLDFGNLRRVPFGAFPSLRTLDVHYCSQIRIVSREAMTLDLLQSARDLEKFARESELACANMINLLQPAYETYGIAPPSLPRPKPLTEYPLDFVLPQEACPPWGDQVQSALDEIQSWAANDTRTDDGDDANTSDQDRSHIDVANAAVRLVMEAFERQDDLELSARLGRKNVQVMDRLSKMESHQKLSIQTIQHCAAQSSKALIAANSFKEKSKGIQEVPLLKWSVIVGNSTGTCTVTANHILFSTQLIPLIGGITNKVFSLGEIQFSMAQSAARSSSILSPLPEAITIEKDGRSLYTFRPSVGSARLKNFLDVVKSVLRMPGTVN